MLRILALVLLALLPNPDPLSKHLRVGALGSDETGRLLRLAKGWALAQVICEGMPEEQWRPLVEGIHLIGGSTSNSSKVYFSPVYGLAIATDRNGRSRGASSLLLSMQSQEAHPPR
jgi:hypothetical protein